MARALAALPVVVLALAACAGTIGSPPHPGSAAPSPTPTPAGELASVPPTPTPIPTPMTATCPTGVRGAAGTWIVASGQATPVPLALTLTKGWDGCDLFFKEIPVAGGGTAPAMVGFWLVDAVYEDPCHWRNASADPATGPSVEELATALDRQHLTDAVSAVPVTLDGFDGLRIEFAVADGVDVADCDREQIAEFRYWDGAHLEGGRPIADDSVFWLGAADAPGRINEAWIVDVDGVRFVAQTSRTADMSSSIRDELHRIIESIDFQGH